MNILEVLNHNIASRIYAASLGQSLEDGLSEVTDSASSGSAEGLVNSIVNFAVPLSVTCVFVLLVYAGYLLISSQGNPDKLQEGKEIITNAIIGFVVVLLSVVILLLIANTLGLDDFGGA